jgi:hypothetical protein
MQWLRAGRHQLLHLAAQAGELAFFVPGEA